MFKDNPIILDTITNSNKRNQKIYCIICLEKPELELFNKEENRFRCPRCRNTFQPNFEIFPNGDILESSHEQEDEEGAGLVCAEDEFSSKDKSDSGKIKRPKYLQDSDTTKVTYYREY